MLRGELGKMVVPFNIARYLAYNSLDNIMYVIFLKYSDIKVLGVGLCVIPSFWQHHDEDIPPCGFNISVMQHRIGDL